MPRTEQLDPHDVDARIALGWGDVSKALATPGRDPYLAAVAHARAGHQDEAVAALEAAHEQKSYWMVYLIVDPRLDALRGHPGFETLVEAIGLPA